MVASCTHARKNASMLFFRDGVLVTKKLLRLVGAFRNAFSVGFRNAAGQVVRSVPNTKKNSLQIISTKGAERVGGQAGRQHQKRMSFNPLPLGPFWLGGSSGTPRNQ